MGLLQSTAVNIRTTSLARGLVEAALVRLSLADKFVDPSSLIERLEPLSRGAPAPSQKKKLFPNAISPRANTPAPVATIAPKAPVRQPPAPPASPPKPAMGGISTAEREQITKDPAVTAVTDLFGGQIVDVKKDTPPTDEPDQSK